MEVEIMKISSDNVTLVTRLSSGVEDAFTHYFSKSAQDLIDDKIVDLNFIRSIFNNMYDTKFAIMQMTLVGDWDSVVEGVTFATKFLESKVLNFVPYFQGLFDMYGRIIQTGMRVEKYESSFSNNNQTETELSPITAVSGVISSPSSKGIGSGSGSNSSDRTFATPEDGIRYAEYLKIKNNMVVILESCVQGLFEETTKWY